MAIQMNKRHQLSIGIVVMIVVILLVHLFIFRPRQSQYQSARQGYLAARNQLQSLPNIVDDQQKWQRYINQTTEYLNQYQNIVNRLNITRPDFYTQNTEAARRQQVEAFNEALMDIVEYREQNSQKDEEERIALTFLGPQGWNFPQQIPETLTENNSSQLVDRLDAVSDKFQILENMTIEDIRNQTLNDLYRLLYELNVNIQSLWQMHWGRISTEGLETFGKIVPSLNIIYQANLFEEYANQYKNEDPNYSFNKQAFIDNFFANIPNNIAPFGYPDDTMQMFCYTRQLEALSDILKRAETHNVSEIKAVYLQEYSTLRDQNDRTKKLGEIAPLRVVFTAENSRVIEMLWEMNHSDSLYELDNITFRSERTGQATLVTADVLFGQLCYIYEVTDAPELIKVADASAEVTGEGAIQATPTPAPTPTPTPATEAGATTPPAEATPPAAAPETATEAGAAATTAPVPSPPEIQ